MLNKIGEVLLGLLILAHDRFKQVKRRARWWLESLKETGK